MARLIFLLLGVEYLRRRWRVLLAAGVLWLLAGIAIVLDAVDGVLYFPLKFFAYLVLLEGLSTLAIATTGVGGQRILRYVKGIAAVVAAVLILTGTRHGNFVLSMIFGTLFLVDGVMQCVAAYVVRFAHWRQTFGTGIFEIVLAIFFFQPYPTFYAGTLPFALGFFLIVAGIKLVNLAVRVRFLTKNPGLGEAPTDGMQPEDLWRFSGGKPSRKPTKVWDGPPADHETALTVHVWTPTGSSKARAVRYPIVDRYIAAVDVNGVISTGHAALESPEGVYVSLYPATEIDRSPEQFGRLLRATPDNNVAGRFLPSYEVESKEWCPSTVRVRIRNYDPARLAAYWEQARQDATYNLTHRNCSSSVAHGLDAALDGCVGRLHRDGHGWGGFLRLMVTPELWVAAQVRKRAQTMAWTPGLALDYARAMSMLADPRPFGWWKMFQLAARQIRRLHSQWRAADKAAERATTGGA